MTVIGIDTETHLIAPGLLAPPIVCLQWDDGTGPRLVHREHTRPVIEAWLKSDVCLVGHNVAYDMGVIAAQWPDLIPLIFRKYDRDQVTDTLLRDQLIGIARGTFRSYMKADGEIVGVKYSLADCVARHFGRQLKKEGWRLFYRAFDQVRDTGHWDAHAFEFQEKCRAGDWPQWALDGTTPEDRAALLAAPPHEAGEYALEDARVTLALYHSQERFGPFLDQFRQARAAFALHLSSCWGLYTDPDAVDALERELTGEFEALRCELQIAGLIREDGTANVAAARDSMMAACAEEAIPLARTKGGAVSLSSDACDRFDEGTTIGQYSRYLTVRKTLSNDIKMLRAGCEYPVQPRYDMADTGRTRASKPNIQAINRGAGIREAFRPRPGKVFIQADFEALELHTLAAWCLEAFGRSALADKLNAGIDVHTEMACDILDITYEEGMARKKKGHPLAAEMKEYRQRIKAVDFGVPGGLGYKKLVLYAKRNYGATLTEEQAKDYIHRLKMRWPELVDHFALAARATAYGDATETHVFTGRVRGGLRYSALCNGRFQALGADCAKEAMWRVTRACYTEPYSPLYGARPVAFLHDEIIAEVDAGPRAAPAAEELGRVMCAGANMYLAKVPVRVAPQIMTVWSKAAEPVYVDGTLVPWEPAA